MVELRIEPDVHSDTTSFELDEALLLLGNSIGLHDPAATARSINREVRRRYRGRSMYSGTLTEYGILESLPRETGFAIGVRQNGRLEVHYDIPEVLTHLSAGEGWKYLGYSTVVNEPLSREEWDGLVGHRLGISVHFMLPLECIEKKKLQVPRIGSDGVEWIEHTGPVDLSIVTMNVDGEPYSRTTVLSSRA